MAGLYKRYRSRSPTFFSQTMNWLKVNAKESIVIIRHYQYCVKFKGLLEGKQIVSTGNTVGL